MATACVDPDDFEVSEGTGQLSIRRDQLGFRQRLVFATAGTTNFDPSAFPNLQRVNVRVIGGGGGSAGATAAAGQAIARPGGSGGGYSETLVQRSAMPGIVLVTVGAGGTAGAAANGGGGDGEASSFGTFAVAPGGFGSTALQTSGTSVDVASAPPGPNPGTGNITTGGQPGFNGIRFSGTEAMSGHGGSTPLGAGGRGTGFQATGQVGTGAGSGAGGAVSTGAAQAGAAGRPGIVIIDMHF